MAWHPLGWRAAWLSEIDRKASGLLAHHYPNTPNYGDMTTLAPRIRAGEIAAPPLLVGGTPCQSYSIAGARQGLADPRGVLTMHYVDILNALDERRAAAGDGPALCLWENVPGVLNDKTNAFGNFLAALAGAGRAYDPPDGRRWSVAGCVFGPRRVVAWRVLDAQYFGLAQRRKRVFVVASARPGPDPREILFEREGVRRDFAPSREPWQEVAGTITASAGRRNGIGSDFGGNLIAFGGGRTGGPIDVAACLTARGQRIDFEVETFAVSVALRGRDGGATAELGDEVAGCLRASTGGGDKPHVLAAARVRRLTPTECERLQGFPVGYTDAPRGNRQAADGTRYKELGNSKAVPVVRWIGERIQKCLT